MTRQITLEKALELVKFEFTSEGWRVRHVKGNVWGDVWGSVTGRVKGDVGGAVCGSVLCDVWGSVKGDVYGDVGTVCGDVRRDVRGHVGGTINGRQWKSIETPEERLRRLIEEGADKDKILEALDRLEDSNG